MADGTTAKLDTSEWREALERFKGPFAEKLARSMAVAGGQLLRDEAKERAPVRDGKLKGAIYLAYSATRTHGDKIVYSVSWNSKSAPHGHLLEFGHRSVAGPAPRRSASDNRPVIRWVPAKPFLRPAFEASISRLQAVMLARGRERFAELLREQYQPPDEDFT